MVNLEDCWTSLIFQGLKLYVVLQLTELGRDGNTQRAKVRSTDLSNFELLSYRPNLPSK